MRKPRILDTQKIKELGINGTSNLDGKWAVTKQQFSEFKRHGITNLPDSTTVLDSATWSDFTVEYSGKNYQLLKWNDGTNTWQIEISKYGFGLAPCGHSATIRMSKLGENVTFLLCNKFKNEVDMSEFVATAVTKETTYPYTADSCLGITCKYYQQSNNSTV